MSAVLAGQVYTNLGHLLGREDTNTYKTTLKNGNSKWLAVSNLQKAIRRSDIGAAQATAHALFTANEKQHLYWRLAIIALEDLGPNYPDILQLALAFCGWASVRNQTDEYNALLQLVARMAKAPKDRTLCNLSCIGYYRLDIQKDDSYQAMRFLAPGDLVALMNSNNIQEAVQASLLLHGKRKERSFLNSDSKKDILAYRESPLFLAMPEDWQTACILGHGFDGLAANMPLMYKFTNGEPIEIKTYEVPPHKGTLIPAAIDMHTSAGSGMLNKISKTLDPWPGLDMQEFTETLTFILEGSILTPKIESISRRMLENLFICTAFERMGTLTLSLDEAREKYWGTISSELEKLRGKMK